MQFTAMQATGILKFKFRLVVHTLCKFQDLEKMEELKIKLIQVTATIQSIL